MEILDVIKNIEYGRILIGISAFYIGVKFPDYDFKLRMKHRSILTHSPLMTIFLLYYYMREPSEILRYFIIGFSFGVGLHLIFDLFPKDWLGGSLLKIPILKIRCNREATINLFRLFIVISLGISVKYTRTELEFWLFFILGIIIVLKNIAKEKKLFRPLISYSLFFFFLGSAKYQGVYAYGEEWVKVCYKVVKEVLS